MKINKLWIEEWIKINDNMQSLSTQITMHGLEVNKVNPLILGNIKGILIGEIIDCIQHPTIKKTYLIKINTGSNKLFNFISKNKLFKKGLKIVFASYKSTLPPDIKIKKKKINGWISEGIICTYSNLFFSEGSSEIIKLPNDAPIGADVYKYLNLNDQIFEIALTPNRSDCLSVLGIARELASINNIKLNWIKISPILKTNLITFPIKIKEPKFCPNFLGRIIKGIDVTAKIPIWMKEKLRRIGIQSTNNPIHDITNYVLMELGQPINVYDLDSLNKTLIVRHTNKNEKFVLIDNSKLVLKKNTLVISDEKNILGIAGILLGKYGTIKKNTKNILIDCSFFNPCKIIEETQNYNIHTEISRRFAAGVDLQVQHKAIERISELILKICGIKKISKIIKISDENYLPKRPNINLTKKNIDNLIGYKISKQKINDILKRLNYKITNQGEAWKVIPPSWRFDIKIEEDVIDEIVRIYGYDNIPKHKLNLNLYLKSDSEKTLSLNRIKNLLVDRGYNEVITYSFVDPKIQKFLYPHENSITLLNPISSKMSVMRLSLLPGLLETIIYNQNRQQNKIRLFESGLRFVPNQYSENNVKQEFMLGGIISGNRYEEQWSDKIRESDFFDIKGDIETIFKIKKQLKSIKFKKNNSFYVLHPEESAEIHLNNIFVGYFGALHPKIKNKLNLKENIIFFELCWDLISKNCDIPKIKKISKFPFNQRDISIIVKTKITAEEILNECKKIKTKHTVEINLFNVYFGRFIEKGYKSFSIRFKISNLEHTLKETEITKLVKKYISKLQNKFHAILKT